MDQAKIKCKFPYLEKLNKAAKERYKIKEMSGLRPYEHKEWLGGSQLSFCKFLLYEMCCR